MKALHDKDARCYLLLLGLCLLLLCGLAAALIALAGTAVREQLLLREASLVSSLLSDGVSPVSIAAALRNQEISEAGYTLLSEAGHTIDASPILLPAACAVMRTVAPWAALGILLFAGGILFLSFHFLSSRETAYRQAITSMERFAAGDFSHRLPAGQPGTLYQMFGEINRLATALQAKGEIEHQTRMFLQDTLSDISHQLKTPLAALRMYTEIMQQEPDHPETIVRFTGKSLDSLGRMERLIQSLLQVMRLDAGTIPLERRPCRLQDLVDRAAADLRTRAAREHKTLRLEGDPQCTLLCDPHWTPEAIGNLVKNALDHTDSGGQITLRWEALPAMLRLQVCDDGHGIAPEDLHHIFKRFYRSRQSRDPQGVGLGLPLTRAIVEQQGGTITVHSKPGEGTVFVLSFLTEL